MPRPGANVAATLNEFVAIDNPLDYHTFIWNQEEKLAARSPPSLSGGFDAGMLILDTPTNPTMSPDTWLVTAAAPQRCGQSDGRPRGDGGEPAGVHAARPRG